MSRCTSRGRRIKADCVEMGDIANKTEMLVMKRNGREVTRAGVVVRGIAAASGKIESRDVNDQ